MADIKTYLQNIKSAIYGKDVRSSIYNGMENMNVELENTTARQIDLESTFNELIINAGNSNAEVVDARVKANGVSYSKLGNRLNDIEAQFIPTNIKPTSKNKGRVWIELKEEV